MTAVSDETGRDWLPLKYEDGPDFCTVTFATGAAFALTVHPERMKLMEAALSASPVAEPWPRATGRAAEDGWTLDPDFLDKAARESETRTGYAVTLESVEDILLDHGQLAPPSAPVAQEPVARLCGYCKTWNSKPCGEQCYLQPSDPVWTSPPAPSAGVGADEIARVFARWKRSKNLHESLAAQNIEKELLALLSRGGDQSNSTHEA